MKSSRYFYRSNGRLTMTEGFKMFLLSLIFVVFVFAFAYVPLFGWSYAFFDYVPGIPLLDTKFVGLKYFLQVFKDYKEIIRVLRNTLVMSFLGILSSPLPVIFAIMLNEIKNPTFKKIVQTTTTLPNFISWVIVFAIAFAFFSTDGLINTIRQAFGMSAMQPNILANTDMTWLFQWLLGTWKSLGWSAIIYIAAIAGIDTELYDAAKVDGASRFQTIMNVTVPGVAETYFVLMLLGISNILNAGFDQYFVFYNPIVADKIEVIDYYVYKVGILTNDFPFSIALGMYKTIISISLLFIANGFAKKIRGNSIV